MDSAERFFRHLRRQPAVLVTVASVRGSVPREVGAWMGVFATDMIGTVGGGRLEFEALQEARQHLSGFAGAGKLVPSLDGEPGQLRRFALGPTLGQCCGGEVHLRFECVTAADVARLQERLTQLRHPVALFGGGHVGRALVRVLADLPLALHWIDSRDEVFPPDQPAHVRCEHSDPVQGAVPTLQSGSRVLIMSFSHAEDLEVLASCLKRQRELNDLTYIGLIGSASKWARFKHRLEERGFGPADFERVTTPIGLAGIHSKLPEVIAVSVAAQLLQLL